MTKLKLRTLSAFNRLAFYPFLVINLFAVLFSMRVSAATTAVAEEQEEVRICSSTREFITTFEFLKSDSDMDLSGDLSLKYASEVSKGCTGAAGRFIETVKSLRKTEMSVRDILEIAKAIAVKDEAVENAFNSIFRRAFAEDGFDLDLDSALRLAKSLSVEFEGETKRALKDFEVVADFCFKRKGLDLPVAKCAELAQRIALTSEYHQEEAGKKFIEAFQFLNQKDGPSLAVMDSLKVAEELLQDHPRAVDNFKLAYEYASARKGLKLSKDEAMKFAKKMAANTVVPVGKTKSSSAK